MSSTRRIVGPLAGAALAAVTPAFAQSAGEDPQELVRRGADLARHGSHREALELLRAAVAAERSGHALAELGFVEQRLGQPLEAEGHLAEALTLTDERWVRHHRRDIEGALSTAREGIGAVRVTSNIDGASVRVNGVVAGDTPLRQPVRVPLGRCVVEARARGYVTASRTVNVVYGEPAEANVPLDRDGPPPTTEAPPTPRCATGLVLRDGLCFAPEPVDDGSIPAHRWLLYSGGAVAVVSAGIAIGLWASGNGAESAWLARCGGPNVAASCAADRADTQDELSSRAAVVNTFWVFSGLGVAAAVVGLGIELRGARRRPFRAGLSLTPSGVRWTW